MGIDQNKQTSKPATPRTAISARKTTLIKIGDNHETKKKRPRWWGFRKKEKKEMIRPGLEPETFSVLD